LGPVAEGFGLVEAFGWGLLRGDAAQGFEELEKINDEVRGFGHELFYLLSFMGGKGRGTLTSPRRVAACDLPSPTASRRERGKEKG